MVFLFCATAFGVVLILGGLRYATVETEIYLLTTQFLDLQAAAALSVLQLVVVTGLLYGRRAGPREPDRVARLAQPRPPTGGDRLPAVLVTLVALLAGGGPDRHPGDGVAARRRRLGLGQLPRPDHHRHGQALLVPVTDALVNSLRTAFDATWMSVGLGLLVSLVVTRRSHGTAERRIRSGLDGFFMLPLGVSAVTLGFGFLITLDEPPLDFRDSPLLVPVAQALVALPLVVRTVAPVLPGIDHRQRQAAASLGASPWRTLLSVDLAVLWARWSAQSTIAGHYSKNQGTPDDLVRHPSP